MHNALIDLDADGLAFWVRWGEYMTLAVGELTNTARLDLAVRATVGAGKGPDGPIDSFPGAYHAPDEAQWFHESRLPVSGANAAALWATGFPWTDRAAAARDGFPISPAAVDRIRTVVERLHQDQAGRFRRTLDLLRTGDAEPMRDLERQSREPAPAPPDAVKWRAEPT